MNIALALMLSGGALVVLGALALWLRFAPASEPNRFAQSKTRYAFYAGLAVLAVVAGTLDMCWMTAEVHGSYETANLSIGSVLVSNEHTPIDQSGEVEAKMESNPANTKAVPSTVVMMYRYGCPDCEESYEETVEWLDTLDADVYWVSSRSDFGQKMREEHMVSEVPSMIVVDANGKAVTRIAYEREEGQPAKLNRMAAELAEHLLETPSPNR